MLFVVWRHEERQTSKSTTAETAAAVFFDHASAGKQSLLHSAYDIGLPAVHHHLNNNHVDAASVEEVHIRSGDIWRRSPRRSSRCGHCCCRGAAAGSQEEKEHHPQVRQQQLQVVVDFDSALFTPSYSVVAAAAVVVLAADVVTPSYVECCCFTAAI